MGPEDKYAGGFTRPYIVQAFHNIHVPALDVLVVAGHFPHPTGPMNFFETNYKLKNVVMDSVKNDVDKVIVIADTNLATEANYMFADDWRAFSSKEILKEIGAPNANTLTTSSLTTCCEPLWLHKGYA